MTVRCIDVVNISGKNLRIQAVLGIVRCENRPQ